MTYYADNGDSLIDRPVKVAQNTCSSLFEARLNRRAESISGTATIGQAERRCWDRLPIIRGAFKVQDKSRESADPSEQARSFPCKGRMVPAFA